MPFPDSAVRAAAAALLLIVSTDDETQLLEDLDDLHDEDEHDPYDLLNATTYIAKDLMFALGDRGPERVREILLEHVE